MSQNLFLSFRQPGMFWRFTLGLCALTLAWASDAAVLIVTSTDDHPPNACNEECTLREAIILSNTLPGIDTVVVPAGVYNIQELGSDDVGLIGDFDITDDVLIEGESLLNTHIRGASNTRVFEIHAGVSASIHNLSVSLGEISSFSAPGSQGAGIRNVGTLALKSVLVTSNNLFNTGGQGGGIYSDGRLSLYRSHVIFNNAGAGGGIYTEGGPIVIVETVLGGNAGANRGGGLYAVGANYEIRFERSTISNNDAEINDGAAIFIAGTDLTNLISLVFRNSTVTGNSSAGMFAAPVDIVLFGQVDAEFHHATLATNSAGLLSAGSNTQVNFSNSILSGVCSHISQNDFSTDGGNVESPGNTCDLGVNDSNNVTAINLDLQSLGNNGGETSTRPIGAGSIAIGHGIADFCDTQDQRALLRDDVNGACDAGAYEDGATIPAPATIFADGFE